MSGGIYFIKCEANGFTYVGSAKDFEKRFGAHLGDLKGGNHRNPHLQNSFNKYGENSLKFVKYLVLGDYDKQFYFSEENRIIEEFKKKGEKLFNIAKAEGGWTYATQERKEEISSKISSSLKEMNSKLTPEERREKYGKGKIGVPLSEERKENLSDYWIGKKKSDETKKKMSEAQKTNLKNKESGKRVGKSNIGRTPPNAKQIEIDGQKFKSIKQASRELNIDYFILLAKVFPEKYANSGKSNKCKIKINDQIFESKSAAAKYFNKSITWVSAHGEIINE